MKLPQFLSCIYNRNHKKTFIKWPEKKKKKKILLQYGMHFVCEPTSNTADNKDNYSLGKFESKCIPN